MDSLNRPCLTCLVARAPIVSAPVLQFPPASQSISSVQQGTAKSTSALSSQPRAPLSSPPRDLLSPSSQPSDASPSSRTLPKAAPTFPPSVLVVVKVGGAGESAVCNCRNASAKRGDVRIGGGTVGVADKCSGLWRKDGTAGAEL